MTVQESIKVGDKIGDITATDMDENPKIYYYIIGMLAYLLTFVTVHVRNSP